MINLATDTVTENIKKESLWTCVGVQVKPEKAINRENPSEYRRIASDYRNPVVLILIILITGSTIAILNRKKENHMKCKILIPNLLFVGDFS